MRLPARLTIRNCAYALDGGTTVLQAVDEAGHEHVIKLVQHAFPQASPPDWIPGRLYFDEELVPMRSDLEAGVLALLRAAEVRFTERHVPGERIQLSPNALILGDDIRQVLTRGPEENIRALTARVIEFVESESYFWFADRVEQAADPTLYTVRVAWTPTTRNQVLVRLGRALGIGLHGAREMLEQGTPLAENVSALKVSELAERYAVEGVSITVEPEFRWRLPCAK